MNKPRVVVIGGGFGGVYTARALARRAEKGQIDLTLISRSNYFLFTPLLHEVATGALSPNSAAEPIREMFRKDAVRIIQSVVNSIDFSRKVVKTNICEIPYDRLVYATGALTDFYTIPGAEEHSITLKNLEDAMDIRMRIIDSFEAALAVQAHRRDHPGEPDYMKELLSFVVVGGGPTGVELAAELAEFIHGTMCTYYSGVGLDWKHVSITLVSANGELLVQSIPKMRKDALDDLKSSGVRVLLGKSVTKVTERWVEMSEGVVIPTSHVFWVGGVKPVHPEFIGTKPLLSKSGRIETDEFMRALNAPEVFILGDAGGKDPMLAQTATEAARVVAKNVMKSLRAEDAGKSPKLSRFVFKKKGDLVSLGHWNATGEIYGFHIHGAIAWFIWRMVYLFKFITWRKRIKVAIEWIMNLFSPRDVTKV